MYSILQTMFANMLGPKYTVAASAVSAVAAIMIFGDNIVCPFSLVRGGG